VGCLGASRRLIKGEAHGKSGSNIGEGTERRPHMLIEEGAYGAHRVCEALQGRGKQSNPKGVNERQKDPVKMAGEAVNIEGKEGPSRTLKKPGGEEKRLELPSIPTHQPATEGNDRDRNCTEKIQRIRRTT